MENNLIRDFRKTLRKLERLIGIRLKNDSCCQGVSVSQCHVLLEIEMHGEATTVQLVQALGLDKSTLSRTIDGLVNIGLLTRKVDPDDRRYTWLRLTTQGRAVCDEINRSNDRFFGKVLEKIPAGERRKTIDGLNQLAAAMAVEAHDGEGCVTVSKCGKEFRP